MTDTIFALATAPGRAAIAVIRVSGPEATRLFLVIAGPLPLPRQAVLRKMRGSDGETFDHGLAIWFPAPRSFTGEDVFELHLHGGLAIIESAIDALSARGARPADPGEFTRRAFEAGRLELSQAEAVADLVDAETQAQRRQALVQLGGSLAKRGQEWRDVLLSVLAFLGAQIDFPEDDLPPDVAERALAPIEGLAAEIEASVGDLRGERIRDGLRIALVGSPNAGKSSLLNALVDRDAAIVAATPGSTRDVIEAPLVVEGYKVLLADMAGLRRASDEVEVEGVRRARAWADQADLRLWLVDPSAKTVMEDVKPHIKAGDVLVFTKADRRGSTGPEWMDLALEMDLKRVESSVVAVGGLDDLRALIDRWVVSAVGGAAAPMVTRVRHRQLLLEASIHLRRSLERSIQDAELIAADVGLAARSLERLSGRMDPEAVLDRIFGSFCIGK